MLEFGRREPAFTLDYKSGHLRTFPVFPMDVATALHNLLDLRSTGFVVKNFFSIKGESTQEAFQHGINFKR
ncbi:hypothetical protein D9M71_841090 [compost metagenome]